jgi:hypothetical protein
MARHRSRVTKDAKEAKDVKEMRGPRAPKQMTPGSAGTGSPAACLARARVVDFEAYRHARAQLTLPLATEAGETASPRPAVTRHGVAHRRRMLAHLGAMLSECRT